MSRTARTCLALALLLGCGLAAASRVIACPLPPPVIRTLELQRFYTDTVGSKIDPVLAARHAQATRPVRSWLDQVVRHADGAVRQDTPSLNRYYAHCALEWLESWAQRDALLETMQTKQAEAERRWTLAGAALAYLKVKSFAPPKQRETVERWLSKLATRTEAAFKASGAKPNNHIYWLGLGLAASAMATGEAARWEMARTIMQEAARAITAEGTLPLELARGRRALHYHAFAAMPLVTLAFLAHVRGEDWTSFNDGALDRLVRMTYAGLCEPERFDELAGVAQEQPPRGGAGWLQLYGLLSGRPEDFAAFETPSGDRWLGGNVFLLATALTPPRP